MLHANVYDAVRNAPLFVRFMAMMMIELNVAAPMLCCSARNVNEQKRVCVYVRVIGDLPGSRFPIPSVSPHT